MPAVADPTAPATPSAPSTAAPAAPPAKPPDPPPATPAAPPAPDAFMSQLMKDLGVLVADDPQPVPPVASVPPKQPDTTAPVPAATTPATPTPPPETPAEPKPAVVKKKVTEDFVLETVRKTVETALAAQKPAPAPPAPPAPDPQAPDARESTLSEVEKEELDLWQFAEQKLPDRYKGAAKRYLDALGKIEEYIGSSKKEDPDRTLDEKDEALQQFVADTLPEFTGADRRRMERALITEEATASARKELEAEQETLRRKQKVLEVKPEIERVVGKFQSEVQNLLKTPTDPQAVDAAIVSEITTQAGEEGWEKAVKDDPFHGPLVKRAVDRASRRASEYLALVSDLKPFQAYNEDLDIEHPKNDHAWLTTFIRRQGDYLSANGGDNKIREDNGSRKEFLPVHKYVELYRRDPTSAVSHHWTFSEADVLSMLADYARRDALTMVKLEVDRASAGGYKRAPKAKPGAPQPPEVTKPETNGSSPKATTGVSPGAATSAPANGQGLFTENDFKALGVPMPK